LLFVLAFAFGGELVEEGDCHVALLLDALVYGEELLLCFGYVPVESLLAIDQTVNDEVVFALVVVELGLHCEHEPVSDYLH